MVTGIVGAHAQCHAVAARDKDTKKIASLETKDITQVLAMKFATMEELILDQGAIVNPGEMVDVARV